jgi:hypothetical protein
MIYKEFYDNYIIESEKKDFFEMNKLKYNSVYSNALDICLTFNKDDLIDLVKSWKEDEDSDDFISGPIFSMKLFDLLKNLDSDILKGIYFSETITNLDQLFVVFYYESAFRDYLIAHKYIKNVKLPNTITL